MTAAEKLVRWRKRQNDGRGISQKEAAVRAGLAQAVWQGAEAGKSPRASNIDAFIRVTDGEVTLSDFAESDEVKAVRRARAAAKRVRHGGGRKGQPDESSATMPDDIEDASLHAKEAS